MRTAIKKQETPTEWLAKTPTEWLAKFLNSAYTWDSGEERIQEQVRRMLEPLIPRKGKTLNTDRIKIYVDALLRTIHRLDLRPRWIILPAHLGQPNQRVCKILGTPWIIRKRSFASSPEALVYLNIISSLESNEFSKLHRCAECGAFFVASHAAMNYCESKCQRTHDRKAAVKRMKMRRAELDKEKLYKARQAADAHGYTAFCRFRELFNKQRNTRDEGNEMNPILERLGDGDAPRGRTVASQWRSSSGQEIWKKLTPRQRKCFL